MNEAEQTAVVALRELHKGEVTILKNGWPDLLVHPHESDEVHAVEVKNIRSKDTVRHDQAVMHLTLLEAGLWTFTAYVDPKVGIVSMETPYDQYPDHRMSTRESNLFADLL